MTEQPQPGKPTREEIQARLQEVSRLLHGSDSLNLESRQALIELVDSLGDSLEKSDIPAEEIEHLAESTAHLAESLHHQHDQTMLSRARERLEEAVVKTEARAPFVSGIARRLLDALANLGI
jgi:hypothetical protein